MNNEMLMWCKNTMRDDVLQKEIEVVISRLLEGTLSNRSEYAQEKCIKSFCEGLHYLESLLLRQYEIHPDNTDKFISQGITKEEYIKRLEEVRAKVKCEISRQYRHFIAFL